MSVVGIVLLLGLVLFTALLFRRSARLRETRSERWEAAQHDPDG